MNKIIREIFVAIGTSGINTDVNISPQNISARFLILSAKNPKYGCSNEENICEQLKIIVAIGIEIWACSAINGIIGFNKPVYMSFTKCAPHNQI